MNSKQDYIAVFDSGVGGISVLRQLRRYLPSERYLYFGDAANAPYGTRPTAEVRQLVARAAEKLVPRGLKALAVACNTATAAAIDLLRETYPGLIIVGIEPALKPAADRFPGGTVGVLATPVTLREEKFAAQARKYADRCRIVKLPAPGLMELVEAGKANSPASEALLRQLLGPWIGKLDGLVLGCTHYPFAVPTLRSILGPAVPLFDGGAGMARETRRRLARADLLAEDGPGELILESSADDPAEIRLCRELLEQEMEDGR